MIPATLLQVRQALRQKVIKKAFNITRKALLILVSEMIGNRVGYALIGMLNRLSGRRLATVFMVYPPTRYYVTATTFPAYAVRASWQPRFAGIYSPAPGRWGLILAVSSLEQELISSENTQRLQAIYKSLRAIRKLTGARSIALAGVLPSTMRNRSLRKSVREREQTAAIVEMAVYATLAKVGFESRHPIILLGGAGYIGAAVYARLQQNCPNPLQVIDPKTCASQAELEAQLESYRGQAALLLNVARNSVLELFLDQLWPQLVILNEVFPEATGSTRAELNRRGIAYFHLAGIRGFALPRFAGPYVNAIPCCALALDDAEQARDRLVIKQL